MLYANKKLHSEERIMDFGTIYQVGMGESGRGRRFMALTCPKDTIVENGMNKNLSIGLTKSGRPRINAKTDTDLYMMLSSAGGYTRRGNGTIQILATQQELFEILARGNGADGDAGRIGTWDCMLLKVKDPNATAVVKVRTSGAGYGTPSDLYIIHNTAVYHCTIDDVEDCCEALGIDVPFNLESKDGELFFREEDWVIL